jgi:hypothetical protein
MRPRMPFPGHAPRRPRRMPPTLVLLASSDSRDVLWAVGETEGRARPGGRRGSRVGHGRVEASMPGPMTLGLVKKRARAPAPPPALTLDEREEPEPRLRSCLLCESEQESTRNQVTLSSVRSRRLPGGHLDARWRPEAVAARPVAPVATSLQFGMEGERVAAASCTGAAVRLLAARRGQLITRKRPRTVRGTSPRRED